jgi:glucosyl-3-phosphoglycerate phosphatase
VTLRRLVLWRHGRTEWNLHGRAQGHAQVPLDEVGEAQASEAAPRLASYAPAFIWSSDLLRAVQTAGALAALSRVDVVLDERLREFDVGDRQGLTMAEFAEKYPELYAQWAGGDINVEIPAAEAASVVADRMRAVLREAAETVRVGETGVIVGHGASLRVGLPAFFGLPDKQWTMFRGMSNCAWAVLEDDGERWGWRLVDYNAGTLPEPVMSDDVDN